MDPNFYTVKDIMKIMGISRSFAYKLISNGEIPVIRLGKKHILVSSAYIRKLTEGANK